MKHSPVSSPAEIGMKCSDIETPALIVDLDTLEENLQKLATYCQHHDIALRPHAKTHKSVNIARLQIELGAAGICCQKTSEAEVFVNGGIDDVLITNQIIGPAKVDRIMTMAREARVAVCVDNQTNAAELDGAARAHGIELEVLVEVDVGGGRCGVRPGPKTLELARSVTEAGFLRFKGLHAYRGNAQHIRRYAERERAITSFIPSLSKTVRLLDSHGIDCQTITGAGTGTYPFETKSGLYSELQCGSYVFMDADYGANLMQDGSRNSQFGNSLFVLTTVMSKPSESRAVCDAGLKAHSIDSGLPAVSDPRPLTYLNASDEHGVISDPENHLRIGDRLKLVPGHCDPTVNLHDWYVMLRDGRIEALWPVSARGKLR
jgi:3-hydroxy-D-aspartate aldolase